jgi:phage gpG-like protein
MQVDIKTNAKKVQAALKKKGKDIDKSMKRALSITAQQGINIIEDRTQDGVGYKGGAFKGYSEKYAKFRRAKGRGKNVDLQFSGRMLGSMTSKADRKKATIFFTRAEEAKKAAMNDKTRPFFGFNRKEEKQLANIFFRYIK